MIRITLAARQRAMLLAARRDATFTPPEQDGLEMGWLSVAGRGAATIAQQLGYPAPTARLMLGAFPTTGLLTVRRERRRGVPSCMIQM